MECNNYRYKDERNDEWFEEESRKFHEKGVDGLSNEGVLNLTETILKEIKIEMNHVIRAHQISPDNPDVIRSVKNMDDLLDSSYFYILTMGHGTALQDYFRRKCGISGRSNENAGDKKAERNQFGSYVS